MAEITQEELQQLKDSLKELNENEDMVDSMMNLLSMPDDQFIVLAPGIMQSYQQSLNNPGDKIGLVQSLNAMGIRAEDITDAFMGIESSIDELAISLAKKDFLKQMLATIVNTVNDTEGIAKRIIEVPIEICNENAKLPKYAHISDSGLDVFAIEDITIHPNETVLAKTGFKVALPPGYELQVRPKSGRALKSKLRICNAPGTIDQGYRDEVGIILENIEPAIKDIDYEFTDDGNIIIKSILHGSDITIGKGEKICQLVLAEVPKVSWKVVNSVLEMGEDRGGGFGSTTLYDKDDHIHLVK